MVIGQKLAVFPIIFKTKVIIFLTLHPNQTISVNDTPFNQLLQPETQKSFLISSCCIHRYSLNSLSEIFHFPSLSSVLYCLQLSDLLPMVISYPHYRVKLLSRKPTAHHLLPLKIILYFPWHCLLENKYGLLVHCLKISTIFMLSSTVVFPLVSVV